MVNWVYDTITVNKNLAGHHYSTSPDTKTPCNYAWKTKSISICYVLI